MSEKLRPTDPKSERINVPGTVGIGNWPIGAGNDRRHPRGKEALDEGPLLGEGQGPG